MRYIFDSIKKKPHPEKAAQAAVSKDAQCRSNASGGLCKGPAFAGTAVGRTHRDPGHWRFQFAAHAENVRRRTPVGVSKAKPQRDLDFIPAGACGGLGLTRIGG